jgi:hypothetical protein
MIVLPALKQYTKSRPYKAKFEQNYLVPDFEQHKDFWSLVHQFLFSLSVRSPFKKAFQEYINPQVGYFGDRIHPITGQAHYYHIGIQIDVEPKQEVTPLLQGVLEYSGYGAVNGHYVLLSHPEIQTEDGYILHTMYCHLKKPLVKFSSYQKMLREISLGSYPIIPISLDTVLGQVGTSGLSDASKPSLYIQCDFRKMDCDPIVVDPINFFDEKTYRNKTYNSLSVM